MRGSISALVLCGVLAGAPDRAFAAPDPLGGIAALLGSTLDGAGAVLGGVGLIAAAGVGVGGDVVQLVDGNRVTTHVFGGLFSGVLHRVAHAVSVTGTASMEAMRAQDVERFPEPREAYSMAHFASGRLTTIGDGLGALWLAVGDLAAGPARLGLEFVGAQNASERVELWRDEASVYWLGPPTMPLEALMPPADDAPAP